MSEQVNKEQTKAAEQENITELTDQQLAEAQGGEVHRSYIWGQPGVEEHTMNTTEAIDIINRNNSKTS